MKTIDEPMPICEAEMERLEDQLVEDCKSLGMAESIRDFLQEPFSEWMDELADESSGGADSSPEWSPSSWMNDVRHVTFSWDSWPIRHFPATRVIWRNPSTDRSVTHQENPTRNVATTAST